VNVEPVGLIFDVAFIW